MNQLHPPHVLSLHAQQRCRKRGISSQDIGFILEYAQRNFNTGAVFYRMRDRDMPVLAPNDRGWRLRNVTVIVCTCERFIVTLYRNKNAHKKNRKKTKYNARKRAVHCSVCGKYHTAA